MGSLYSEHTTWLHGWRAGTKLALLAAGACRVSLVTAAKTIPESGDPLFVPARDIPSFVQDDAP